MKSRNLLDEIDITADAYQKYIDFANEMAEILQKERIKPNEIPDENAIQLKNGSLEIFVDIRGKRISCFLDANEWRFKNI